MKGALYNNELKQMVSYETLKKDFILAMENKEAEFLGSGETRRTYYLSQYNNIVFKLTKRHNDSLFGTVASQQVRKMTEILLDYKIIQEESQVRYENPFFEIEHEHLSRSLIATYLELFISKYDKTDRFAKVLRVFEVEISGETFLCSVAENAMAKKNHFRDFYKEEVCSVKEIYLGVNDLHSENVVNGYIVDFAAIRLIEKTR